MWKLTDISLKIKKEIDNGVISFDHVPSCIKTANIFTKALPRPTHENIRSNLGMIDIYHPARGEVFETRSLFKETYSRFREIYSKFPALKRYIWYQLSLLNTARRISFLGFHLYSFLFKFAAIGKNPSLTSARENAKIKYISGGNPHPMS